MGEMLLEAVGLSKRFRVGRRNTPWSRASHLHAVDDVDLRLRRGESVGLVGESGCGKSTLVRLLARLIDPSAGAIVFENRDIAATPALDFARLPERARIQMVFQDPTDSLNPRFTAADTIAEPMRLLGGVQGDVSVKVGELAGAVGLAPELLGRFPHQLSGGQKARVGIARALACDPALLILDEPTSALDVSVQVLVLKLLAQLKRERGLSYLFVSHDLNVVRLLCDRVVVMYLGRVIESGPAAAVFDAPRHPYTRALLDAVPAGVRGRGVARSRLEGEVRSPIDPPAAVCRFHGRCPQGFERCGVEMPKLSEIAPGHAVACHLARQ